MYDFSFLLFSFLLTALFSPDLPPILFRRCQARKNIKVIKKWKESGYLGELLQQKS